MNQNGAGNHRILVIDDTESIHNDFRKTLAAQEDAGELEQDEAALFGAAPAARQQVRFSIDSALQGQEGFQKVRQAVRSGQPYALAFVDMRMPPGWDGVQTIEQLWKEDPNLQVVICTAYSDYSWNQIIERLGVNDRLLVLKKPFDNAEVSQLAVALTQKWSLTQQAMIKVDQLENLVAQRTAELVHAATHDKLTGLPNRAQLSDCLRRAIARRREDETAFAVLFLDFDRFKIINDSLGHEIGDLLLIGVADRLRAVLGDWHSRHEMLERWTAARLGGDEFVILLEGKRCLEAAPQLADVLLAELRAPYNLRGYEVYSTASIGITGSDIGYETPEAVVRDADAAMYRAKSSGRDRYVVFDRSMHEQTLARLELETGLRRALARMEFMLYYQPIVENESGRIVGLEALIRWQHPERGLVPPDQFISIAEETGLIIPVGQWVMQSAVEQLVAWHRKYPGIRPLYVSVNLSKQQLLDPCLVRQVRQLLTNTGLDPASLKLEVTESIVMEKVEVVTGILQSLRDLGVGLSMDDFGTGHSSLNCLHMFPIDVLKIDRAFICNLEHNIEYTAVVQAIITLASNMRMKVTAEGIETSEQLAQIQALDCDSGQGYLFSRPLPAHEAEVLLAVGKPLGRRTELV